MKAVFETAQAYYDSLVADATNGNFPAVSKEGRCRYRADGTASCQKRCAVGKLIPDESYDSRIEGMHVTMPPVHGLLFGVPVGIEKYDLWYIQNAHDSTARAWNQWSSSYELLPWNPRLFVQRLNEVKSFEGCKLVDPNTLPERLEPAEAVSV